MSSTKQQKNNPVLSIKMTLIEKKIELGENMKVAGDEVTSENEAIHSSETDVSSNDNTSSTVTSRLLMRAKDALRDSLISALMQAIAEVKEASHPTVHTSRDGAKDPGAAAALWDDIEKKMAVTGLYDSEINPKLVPGASSAQNHEQTG
jgi:hypothetical protein